MRKFISFFSLLGLLLLGVWSCSDDVPEIPVNHRVLIYLVADNNLSDSADESLLRITSAYGASAAADLYVFIDNYQGGPVLYQIDKQGNKAIVAQFAENNSVAGSFIRQVCQSVFVTDKRVAPKNTLVFWSHGTNWFPSEFSTQLRSFGDDEGKQIDIPELAECLQGIGVHNLLFDACLMGSAEVAAELAEVADYLVASPAEILTDSYPYETIIPVLCQEYPDLRKVVDLFYDYYQGQPDRYQSGTLALYDLTRVDDLARAYGALVKRAYGSMWEIPSPALPYDRFSYHLFYDIQQVVDGAYALLTERGDQEAEGLYRAWTEAFRACMLHERHTDRFLMYPIKDCCGMSVYVPTDLTLYLKDFYLGLKWTEMAFGK